MTHAGHSCICSWGCSASDWPRHQTQHNQSAIWMARLSVQLPVTVSPPFKKHWKRSQLHPGKFWFIRKYVYIFHNEYSSMVLTHCKCYPCIKKIYKTCVLCWANAQSKPHLKCFAIKTNKMHLENKIGTKQVNTRTTKRQRFKLRDALISGPLSQSKTVWCNNKRERSDFFVFSWKKRRRYWWRLK